MEPHFTEELKFISRELDRVTGKPIIRHLEGMKTRTDLGNILIAAKSSTDKKSHVQELHNLLDKMLLLDPSKRIGVREALAHSFIKK
uniref:Serine/threonine protein kinase putative n=1 Tax=Albugo laibachii Nc14 TaxID=890382 RepID=F0WD82_9STRA|nr:serine/threonine protein kinase putative [Albugo laibachii Nc14]|eukprot:CCA19154.1 serine/threonine protein kinase putative [Albugo laibachii Nc14]